MDQIPYDEFSLFHENAEEWGLPYERDPFVRREATALPDGRSLSGLRWGEETPSLIMLHGGAQNAHTYDTVALAIERPLLALDLPGHGQSDGGAQGKAMNPASMAEDVAHAIEALSRPPVVLVGMSLGGLTSLHLAASRPDLISRVAFIDITPGVNGSKAQHITAFVNGPEGFESFDELLARTIEFNPTRSESSLRRGILHNALQLEDGTWVWRWARHRSNPTGAEGEIKSPPTEGLWDLLGSLTQPVMLVRGMDKGSVVDDDDEQEFRRRLPTARIEHVQGAGHSIQGDQPLVLATLIQEFAS